MTRFAAVQHDIVWTDRSANFERLAPLITAAAGAGADIVVLTETFSTGFAVDHDALGEPEGGPSSQFLAEQAAAHGVWVAGSCPEIPEGSGADRRPYNSLVIAGPDGTQHRYRKIHPFTHAGEDKTFRAGTELVTVEIGGLRITPFVCYDLRFADEFWQAARHTDVYLVPANWPAKRRAHWRALLRARAIENQAYVIGVNRVGEGGGIEYAGDSVVVHPGGAVLAEASEIETILLADVDQAEVADLRHHFRFLQDRRTS